MTVNIVKEQTCPSLSGKTTLKYQLGKNPEEEIYLRIEENRDNGLFNEDWIALVAVHSLLSDQTEPFPGNVLQPLFEGRSVNTSYFIMAALLHQEMVSKAERGYVHSIRITPRSAR